MYVLRSTLPSTNHLKRRYLLDLSTERHKLTCLASCFCCFTWYRCCKSRKPCPNLLKSARPPLSPSVVGGCSGRCSRATLTLSKGSCHEPGGLAYAVWIYLERPSNLHSTWWRPSRSSSCMLVVACSMGWAMAWWMSGC